MLVIAQTRGCAAGGGVAVASAVKARVYLRTNSSTVKTTQEHIRPQMWGA